MELRMKFRTSGQRKRAGGTSPMRSASAACGRNRSRAKNRNSSTSDCSIRLKLKSTILPILKPKMTGWLERRVPTFPRDDHEEGRALQAPAGLECSPVKRRHSNID